MAYLWLFVVLSLASTAFSLGDDRQDSTSSSTDTKHVEIYNSLFNVKRREQIETAERVWNVDDYAKQYKAVTFVVDNIFPILQESMKKINDMKYVPGLSPFPEEQTVQEILGTVYENVIFFGDFLLRMPDITKKVFKKHKEWLPVLEEAVAFCNKSTEIYTGPHARQLHLMSQELGLVSTDPDYVNPFRQQQKTLKDNTFVKRTKDKEDKKRKGPKLRNTKQFKSEL